MSAFLDVETSLTGRRWTGPDDDRRRRAEKLSQEIGLEPHVASILARAGVDPSAADAYLAPALRDLMPDPSSLNDMDAAAEIILDHALGGKRIAIFADYDVDGAASAALLHDWLVALGARPTIYVPDRIDEGYGPNVPAMEDLTRSHALIVCVDCGTVSHDPIAAARALGAEVIVLDHHLGGETLPPAAAVVNPNRQDEVSEHGYLCAAGVVYLLLVALNRALRHKGQQGPDLLAMLDIVALATVADVAPLVGLNRAFVRQGLRVMAARQRVGLAALGDVAGLRTAPTPYHLGFLLGPRINAGGRVGAADLGVRLLTSQDPQAATKLAERLDQLNRERREIEAEVLAAATAEVEARGIGPLAWAAGEGWHPGVVGIVASRLKERFNRPAVVIGLDGDSGTGSGRSVAGIDLGAAVAALARDGTLLRGGGHRMAAGLTVARDQVEPAMTRLGEALARQGAGQGGAGDLAVDGLLAAAAATPELVSDLDRAGPYGASAPAPRFAFQGLRVDFAREVGQGHLQLRLIDGTGRIDAIAFRAFETPLGASLTEGGSFPFHFAGRLEIDDWGGRRKAKLRVEDAARPE